jgi:hypothetical protein
MHTLRNECNKLGIEISCPTVGKKKYLDCFWPARAAFVTAEGYVTPCNYRMNPGMMSFGNLFTQTLDEYGILKNI